MRVYALSRGTDWWNFDTAYWDTPNHLTCRRFVVIDRRVVDTIQYINGGTIIEFKTIEEAAKQMCKD